MDLFAVALKGVLITLAKFAKQTSVKNAHVRDRYVYELLSSILQSVNRKDWVYLVLSFQMNEGKLIEVLPQHFFCDPWRIFLTMKIKISFSLPFGNVCISKVYWMVILNKYFGREKALATFCQSKNNKGWVYLVLSCQTSQRKLPQFLPKHFSRVIHP